MRAGNSYKKILLVGIASFIVIGSFIGGMALGYMRPSFLGKIHSAEADIPTSPANKVNLEAFWKAWSLLESKFAGDDPNTEDRLWGAIAGLVASYKDPYTEFFPPKEATVFDETIKGEFEGVGMEVGIRDGYLTVIAPFKDAPADKAGVQAKDVIIAIDDLKTEGMSIEESIQHIRGKKGTAVKLTVVREGEENPIEISMFRDVINVPTIKTRTKDGVFIIELYSFSPNATGLMRGALEEFKKSKMKYLIIDLRDNPGGYLDTSIDIASMFLPVGKPVVREDFGDDKEEVIYRSRGFNLIPSSTKIAVLVNGGSASASEILAGALQEHKRATLVGTKTFGKGSVQQAINLTDTTVIKITVAQWLTPNGISISKEGLTPTILISDEEIIKSKENKNNSETTDIVLEKAIKALKK